MKEYLDLAERVLTHGKLKKNRTGIDTISSFAEHYKVDLSKGFPLLTT
ncbi:MAG: thymidylate synthase, partial [Bacteroidetes bacterium]|nr:thymidylate synthase [Bacteroidota bacterium]